MDKKIRVFWHETGHFVAACYNKQHYQGLGTDFITIEHNSAQNDYYGYHQPLRPSDYVPNGHIRHHTKKSFTIILQFDLSKSDASNLEREDTSDNDVI